MGNPTDKLENKANVLEGNNKFETNETTNPPSTKPKKDVFDSQNDQVSIDGQIVKAGQELLYKVNQCCKQVWSKAIIS